MRNRSEPEPASIALCRHSFSRCALGAPLAAQAPGSRLAPDPFPLVQQKPARFCDLAGPCYTSHTVNDDWKLVSAHRHVHQQHIGDNCLAVRAALALE